MKKLVSLLTVVVVLTLCGSACKKDCQCVQTETDTLTNTQVTKPVTMQSLTKSECNDLNGESTSGDLNIKIECSR